jgi:hypothetical protein
LTPERATVWIDGVPVTILPRRAPVGNSGPIRGRSLAVFDITGGSGSVNANTKALLAVLPDGDRELYRAAVEPTRRNAIAVTDLTEAECLAAAAALGFDEILYWDGRRARVLVCR